MTWSARIPSWAAVAGAVVTGLLLRSTWFSEVFRGDGRVLLGVDDSLFHARRALYSFARFPEVLDFDWYLAFPRGAAAPAPPLFDWLLAAVARLHGDDEHSFEVVAAWASPVLGALLSLPAFWIGRAVAGPSLGVAAAWIAAVLPAGILVTMLGNCDHHGAVALLAACWLASTLGEVGTGGRTLARRAALHAAIVAAMLLTWSGSLLYLLLGEGARLGAIALCHGRPQRGLAVAASLVGAALPVGAWLLASDPPLGGPWTSQTLSWLHWVALLALAALATALALAERRAPAASAVSRLARAAALAGAVALAFLAVPHVLEALRLGIGFVGKRDPWAAVEQTPLFTSLPASVVRPATTRFGLFAYLVPLAPFFVGYGLFRTRGEQREHHLVLLCWVTGLGALLLSQVRFGTDFAVPGAVAFALALGLVRRGLARRVPSPVATALVALLAAGLAWPGLQWHVPGLRHALSELRGGATRARHATTPLESAYRFGEEVRRLTPETGGFLDAAVRPEYGVLVPPSMGHLFTYVARRPVPANNLGPYLDLPRFRDAHSFYRTQSPTEALALLERLGVRYALTVGEAPAPRTFASALHRTNGSGMPGQTHVGHLRLVAQSPPGSSPLPAFAPRGWPGGPAYKLFERVEGAVLVARTPPLARVEARIVLALPNRGQPYTTVTLADPGGAARLRVPYASHQPVGRSGAVGTRGTWRVSAGGHSARVEVTEEDVRLGREVSVLGLDEATPVTDPGV